MGVNGVVSSYPTSTNLPRVDGLSTNPRELGWHNTILCAGTYVTRGLEQ